MNIDKLVDEEVKIEKILTAFFRFTSVTSINNQISLMRR